RQVNPVPTIWFQSINAIAIFILAPPFAVLWTWLARRGRNPSIPTKMALGVFFMSLSVAIMAWAAAYENGPTTVAFAGPAPEGVFLNDQNQLCRKEDGKLVPFHAGRLTYDPAAHEFHLRGVLSDIERDAIAGATAPAGYVEALKDLQKQTEDHQGSGEVKLAEVPAGFDLRYSGLNEPDSKGHRDVTFDPDQKLLKADQHTLKDRDIKFLRVAGADEALRKAVDTLYVQSSRYRVSS